MVFYPILFLSFWISDSLTAAKSKAWRHHRLFGGKILRIYCWKKNQPAKFDKTDYQTLPIKNFSLYLALLFHDRTKRLCPDPIVGFGARLAENQSGFLPMFFDSVLKSHFPFAFPLPVLCQEQCFFLKNI